jgi:hypothetical protein
MSETGALFIGEGVEYPQALASFLVRPVRGRLLSQTPNGRCIDDLRGEFLHPFEPLAIRLRQ